MDKENKKPFMLCRVAWMNKYEGIKEGDIPMGGGEHVKDHGRAFEEYNFLDYKGKCYGYVWGNLKNKN